MHPRVVCAVFALFLPLGVAAGWLREPLGSPPAGYSQPNVRDINDRGQVLGTVFDNHFGQRVFVWEDGNWTILPTLGGRWAWPEGINNRGQIVGVSETTDLKCETYEGHQYCNYLFRGFVWEHGQLEELGSPGFESGAQGINNAGTVVGWYEDAGGEVAAVWDAAGRVTQIGSFLGGWVSPQAVNDRGQVVGTAYDCTVDDGEHALVWDRHGGGIDLGSLGGPASVTSAINAWGKVTGYGNTDRVLDCVTNEWGTFCRYAMAPFTWEDGVLTALPVLGGDFAQAVDVNNDGVVVGTSDTDELIRCQEEGGMTYCIYRYHAVVWLDGELIDLGQAGKWSYASAINNDWVIAGWAEGVGPVIWRPVEPVE